MEKAKPIKLIIVNDGINTSNRYFLDKNREKITYISINCSNKLTLIPSFVSLLNSSSNYIVHIDISNIQQYLYFIFLSII